MAKVFVTGATGYIGRELTTRLLARGHTVRALARKGSERRIVPGCEAVVGDALDETTYASAVGSCDAFVHLVGVSHPSPSKAEQFRAIDLRSTRAAVSAAQGHASHTGTPHFIYVSVAHPAPVMKSYIAARAEGEAAIRNAGLNATVLRPWYVLGPGHRWPILLVPMYRLLECWPRTRESARRLGLVSRGQMVDALVDAVEHPARGVRIVEVPEIRKQAAASV